MRRTPVELARPVVVLNGYHGWWGLASTVRDGLREATGSNNIICVSYAHRCSLAAAAKDVRAALAKHLGDDYASGRGAFDCVGISMGGIVASALAAKGASDEDERVLRAARAGESLAVARVFTLGTPHRGAMLAERVRPDLAARELRAGSPVLQALQRAVTAGTTPKPYCFAQTRDAIVGMHNARPRGVRLQRMPGPVIGSHFTSARNPVFWAAIARELRGETSG
jgi:pimeloyl-ACP methyl ester carboxylesterase